MQELLPAALLGLMLAGMAFAWVDWRLRLRKLPKILGPSWDCPACGIVNEAEISVCWSCGAAVAQRSLYPGFPSPETWRCLRCRHWNATSRKSCWSCATMPTKQSTAARVTDATGFRTLLNHPGAVLGRMLRGRGPRSP